MLQSEKGSETSEMDWFAQSVGKSQVSGLNNMMRHHVDRSLCRMVLKMFRIASTVSEWQAHGSVHSIASATIVSKSGTRWVVNGVLLAIERTKTVANRLPSQSRSVGRAAGFERENSRL